MGLAHLGRFAARYRERYSESPSATLRRGRVFVRLAPSQPITPASDRPTIAVLPFDLIGPNLGIAAGLSDEIAAAIWRLHWINVVAPSHARYHLRGKICAMLAAVCVTVFLIEASIGRTLWAERWDGDCNNIFGLEETVAAGVVRVIQPALREAEIDRARRQDRASLTAWELTMRALPSVVSLAAASEGIALDCSNRPWNSLRRIRCRCPSQPGAMACVPATTSPRDGKMRRRRRARLRHEQMAHSCGVKCWSRLPMRRQTPSTVRSSALRSRIFSFAKTCSIGLRSGL